jgi:hypothetical protein
MEVAPTSRGLRWSMLMSGHVVLLLLQKGCCKTQEDNTMNAVRGRTGLGRFGGVLIPSMAVDENVDVGEY